MKERFLKRRQRVGRYFGRRYSEARMLVWEILNGEDGHLSADEIYAKAIKKYPGIGIATVYRALDLFLSLGEVRRLDVGDGKARYEVIKSEDEHLHLICRNCGRVIEMVDKRFSEEMAVLFAKVEKRYGFYPEGKGLSIYGSCKKCKGGD